MASGSATAFTIAGTFSTAAAEEPVPRADVDVTGSKADCEPTLKYLLGKA